MLRDAKRSSGSVVGRWLGLQLTLTHRKRRRKTNMSHVSPRRLGNRHPTFHSTGGDRGRNRGGMKKRGIGRYRINVLAQLCKRLSRRESLSWDVHSYSLNLVTEIPEKRKKKHFRPLLHSFGQADPKKQQFSEKVPRGVAGRTRQQRTWRRGPRSGPVRETPCRSTQP